MLEVPSQMNDAITGATAIPEVMLFIKKANETLQKTRQRLFKRHKDNGIT